MSNSVGRRGRPWRELREEIKSQRGPCWICGQAIDYAAAYPADESFTVDHVLPWISNPELREDRANLRPAHARCNKNKGTGTAPDSLGTLIESW